MDKFKKLILVVLCIATFPLAGCNTVSGFGQDLSETGRALGGAADWSQNQIQSVAEDNTSTGSEGYNQPSDTGVVIEEPAGMTQY